MNLLINAAQAIEQRGELHISTRREGHEVVVRIRDTGQGMSPETLEKLFHKGRIEVESELGRGITFAVRLPLAEQ